MDLTGIKETCLVSSNDVPHSPHNAAIEKVNQLIKEGWVLINMYTSCIDPMIAPGNQVMHYVLGR